MDYAPLMKTAATTALLVLLTASGCSRRAKPEPAPSPSSKPDATTPAASVAPVSARNELHAEATGSAFGLRVDGGVVSFCDERGGRKLDATTGLDTAFRRACPEDDESNPGCGRVGFAVDVRTPGLGPDDFVDVDAHGYPMQGLVHDCAAEGKVLAIVTGSTVVLIDTTKEKAEVIAHEGASRVSIDRTWIAWSLGSTVRARRR